MLPLVGAMMLASSVAVAGTDSEAFPYSAYVVVDRAPLYSGPGDEFYQTDVLAWGTRLDVYHHLRDGWCAVRPPEGSFSWVAARQVELIDQDRLAIVHSDNAVTRVGTRLSDDHHAASVRLKRGEILEVLGTAQLNDAQENRRQWVKIAPPSGEFRWIRRELVAERPPTRDDASQIDAGESKPSPPSDEQRMSRSAADLPASAPGAGHPAALGAALGAGLPAALGAGLPTPPPMAPKSISDRAARSREKRSADQGAETMATFPIPPAKPSVAETNASDAAPSPDAVTSASRPPEESAWVAVSAPVAARSSQALAEPSEPARQSSSTSLSGQAALYPPTVNRNAVDELDELNLQLSRTVAGDLAQWELEPIRQRARRLLTGSSDERVRQPASRLLERIDEFQDVQRRFLALADGPSPAESGGVHGAPISAVQRASYAEPADVPTALSTTDALALEPEIQPRRHSESDLEADIQTPPYDRGSHAEADIQPPAYDGRGWLMPVVTPRRDLPTYALADDHGRILQFVSPQPGLNLRRYLRQKIGIIGEHGFIRSLQSPHLLARRVILLARHPQLRQ